MTRIRPEFRGVNHHRYSREPLERKLAELWQHVNCRNPSRDDDVLGYLLQDPDRGNTRAELSPRDREVAASVIQWLGSHCGQAFLKSAGFERKERRA